MEDGRVFEFESQFLETYVALGDSQIAEPIQIVAFSISGRVVHDSSKQGIQDVHVMVNGDVKSTKRS